ncbi:COP9 signalosome complex subunit 6 [Galdieria sulphuraria]|uniref:COP9 signalosome complex subunit 6 n=1 Tax=Galdieria sulphuraria TaxID=130081 RepID=M2WVD5_GALSU|nr:COP9 signalosome complex subunit 6 [Galdieria sulphuraria]EME27940.1 COP9 signalosome complex subunit 6 [Galdieria sulphuraria]|eukprot:XP_005704460.1 COP9 signalosome complex subunit 6 [Galdieria sulphuraria]
MVSQTTQDSSLSVSLHPGVILAISDHYVRSAVALGVPLSSSTMKTNFPKAESEGSRCRVLGCLLGIQNGRTIEISNCFELTQFKLSLSEQCEDPTTKVDIAFLYSRKEQYKTIFPHLEIFGWYSTGNSILPGDISFHKFMTALTENPLFLCLDTEFSYIKGELPASLYACDVHFQDNQPQLSLTPISFQVASSQVERISLEHVARTGINDDSSASSVLYSLHSVSSAVRMLLFRMKVLRSFLEMTLKGNIPKDANILRELNSIHSQLASVGGKMFSLSKELEEDYNDTLVVSYLTAITKALHLLNQVVDKFQTSPEGALGSSRHFRGAFL